MPDILLILIIKPSLSPTLQRRALELAANTLTKNPGYNINVHVDRRPVILEKEQIKTPWSKVAVARNRVIDSLDIFDYEFLLWVDADVVYYPPDMPSRLIEVNPYGVTAPLVLIENSKGPLVYDFAACVMKDCSHIEPTNRSRLWGRNLQHEPPYWPKEPTEPFVEMDCVGTITMVDTSLYMGPDGRIVHYQDHPAFTDHFPICEEARLRKRRVGINRDVIAWHADLPMYGEAWH